MVVVVGARMTFQFALKCIADRNRIEGFESSFGEWSIGSLKWIEVFWFNSPPFSRVDTCMSMSMSIGKSMRCIVLQYSYL